jgi:Mg-chelatase subunit ChlD
VFEYLARQLRAWAADTRGNVAMIFIGSFFVLLCAIGGAIDFSHSFGLRTRLQDSCDTAVLAAAVDPSKTEAEMQVIADKAFAENMTGLENAATTKLTKTVDAKGSTVLIYTASTQVPTQFLGLIGMSNLSLQTLSKSDATIRNTEIAFVLDSTGSMANDARMTNLKSSVDSMLLALLDAAGANSSNTKVAIVPFDTQVKIDAGINLPYIDYGKITVSQGCKSGTNGYLCNILKDSYDKICKTATDMAQCKQRVKVSYKTYTSGDRTYYVTQLYSYEGSGGNYTLYSYSDTIYTITTTVNNPGGTSTNAETGVVTTTQPSTSSSTTQYFESQNGAKSTVADLTTYNATPSGFTAGTTSTDGTTNLITYSASYSNGYGAVDAVNTSATGYYNSTTKDNNVYTTFGTEAKAGDYGKTKIVSSPAYASNQSAWTGFVIDRYSDKTKKTVGGYDTSADSAVSSDVNSLYPARPMVSGSKLVNVMGLTSDISGARTRVQNMQPSGETNITIGMQWGMEVLSPEAPFTGGSNWKTPLYTKYIILVTDGMNVKSRDYSGTDIDKRTALACQAAKDKGIIVFVVKLIEGNSSMLETCASSKAYYYDLTSASQLGDTMKTILKSIRKIKLAQ